MLIIRTSPDIIPALIVIGEEWESMHSFKMVVIERAALVQIARDGRDRGETLLDDGDTWMNKRCRAICTQ